MKIYLAGKMDATYGAWRDALLEGQDGDYRMSRKPPYWELVRDSQEGDLDLSELGVAPWPTAANTRVLGLHDYVGPYRTTYAPEIDSKYTGYFHGSTVTGQHGQSNFDDHAAIIHECRRAIGRADLFFAYINRPDCFGTLVEMGVAKALGVYVVGGIENESEWDWDDYWFAEAICDVVLPVPTPIVAGAKPVAPDAAPGFMYGHAANDEWRAYHEAIEDWHRRASREQARAQRLLKDAIVAWTGRPARSSPVELVRQDDAEPYRRALQESAQSLSQIARWTADPRVRSEAQRMLRKLTG